MDHPPALGYFALNSHQGIRPDVLARALEERGYESLWIGEHSHVPVAAAAEVPEIYRHFMDPYVSLAVAAAATSRLRLATGVSMILEHDLVDLACRVGTLDVLSGGRLVFGVGAGWVREELEAHRPDLPWRLRYAATAERVEALRTIWGEEQASFEGRFERLRPSFVYPKPLQRPLPVVFGGSGEVAMRYAAACADEWYPIDVSLRRMGGVGPAIVRFRQAVEEAGRDPGAVGVTICAWGYEPGTPSARLVASYGELGAGRVVVGPPSQEPLGRDDALRRLDEYLSLLA